MHTGSAGSTNAMYLSERFCPILKVNNIGSDLISDCGSCSTIQCIWIVCILHGVTESIVSS